MSSFKWPPAGGSGITTYANFAAFPVSSPDGTVALALDTDILYVFNSGSMSWIIVSGPGAVLSIGSIDSGTASVNGAQILLNNLVMQSASTTRPGLVNNTTQSFSGNKTFTGTIGASNLSGTNTGDVSLGSANGLSLLGQALSLDLSSTSTTGSLSSTDWNTFNGKQASGNYITDLTGDVAASGPGSAASTIQANVVSNSKLAQVPAHSYLGNNTGSTVDASYIGATALTADLDVFTNLLKGLAPASGGGTANFLRADGTWAAPTGTGTVSSVAFNDASNTPIFSITGSPVTTNGTLTQTLVAQDANKVFAGPTTGVAAEPGFRFLVSSDVPTINPAQGGTGQTSLTANNVILGNGTSAVLFVAPGSSGNVLTSNGTTWTSAAAGSSFLDNVFAVQNSSDTSKQFKLSLAGMTASRTLTISSTQSTNQTLGIPNVGASDLFVTNDTSATLTNKTISGASNTITNVSLTAGVTGTLPVANGGTGDASLTAYAVLCGGTTSTSPVQSIAAVGSSGQVLTSNGAGALPTFQDNPASPAVSEVWVTSGNGNGSTNTCIRIYVNVQTNTGSDITYATSATLGDTFTINTTGRYGLTVQDAFSAIANIGISKNSSQLSTSISSINVANFICRSVNVAGQPITVSAILNLTAGDVIRGHNDGSALGTGDTVAGFRIIRLA